MTDPNNLLPPSDGDFAMATPSGLSPGTRSQAEEVFALNATQQTDSAAPDPALNEAQKAYRRPGIPRASSHNYEDALRRAQESSVSSDLSATTIGEDETVTGAATVASPTGTTPFPPPGQGVVPLNYGHVGAAQGDSIKKTRSRGLSLSALARQQSWNEEDYKHVYSAKLAEGTTNDAGYDTSADKKADGP